MWTGIQFERRLHHFQVQLRHEACTPYGRFGASEWDRRNQSPDLWVQLKILENVD